MAKDDITIIQEHETPLHDVSTDEVLTLMLGEDEEIFGRMSVMLDESEFDYLPPFEVEADEDQAQYLRNTDDAMHAWQASEPVVDEVAGEFESPTETFPLYKRALKHFRSAETPARVLRVDTDHTYNGFVGDAAIKELGRRLGELRQFVEEHVADHHGAPVAAMSEWKDVIGAAEAVKSLRAANTAEEATDALPQIPLDLPEFARGKVKCWRDGDCVVVSMRFCAADGTPRIATMAAKPKVDTDSIVGWSLNAGVDPVTILGLVPDLAATATGKRLVRDVAGAALGAQRRLDVVGMTDDGDKAEPILLTNGGADESVAPLAALMYVEQLADAGDPQAESEMNLIRMAAETPSGRQIAAPILSKSSKKLSEGRARKALLAGCE